MELLDQNIIKKGHPDMFFNRELSWIEFNRRVLEEAADEKNHCLNALNFFPSFSTI